MLIKHQSHRLGFYIVYFNLLSIFPEGKLLTHMLQEWLYLSL